MFPNHSSNYTFKEQMMNIFILHTKTTLDRFIHPFLIKIINSGQLIMREKPKKKTVEFFVAPAPPRLQECKPVSAL
jgi:hypothetical protein